MAPNDRVYGLRSKGTMVSEVGDFPSQPGGNMSHPGIMVDIRIDARPTFQTKDGFGVNINARYFEPRLLPAMDLLVTPISSGGHPHQFWG